MNCISVCESPASHHLYFDNFFTHYDLVSSLKSLGYRATGTIRVNCMKGCVMKGVEGMRKSERGTYDYRSDGDVEMVRWNDNSIVTFCSNACGVYPVRPVKRLMKSKSEMIPQPNVVAKYNKGKGGVELLDRALEDYRPKIRGKKWYWSLLIYAINMITVFIWRVYQLSTNAETKQKDFRRSLAVMLRQSKPRPTAESIPGPSFSLLSDVRTDNFNLYPESCPVRRCTVCRKNCRIHCMKCKKSMHLRDCFKKYHENTL